MIETVLSGVEAAAAVSVKSDADAGSNRPAAANCADCAVNAVNAAIAFRVPIDSEVGTPVAVEADTVLANSEATDGEGGRIRKIPQQ